MRGMLVFICITNNKKTSQVTLVPPRLPFAISCVRNNFQLLYPKKYPVRVNVVATGNNEVLKNTIESPVSFPVNNKYVKFSMTGHNATLAPMINQVYVNSFHH